MKVIIAGGRDFTDKPLLFHKVDEILDEIDRDEIEIVSGGAAGADFYGNAYAVTNGLNISYFPANWSNLGKSAGPIRNKQMAEYAAPDGVLIAFWDGKSKGTKNMIEEAEKSNLKIHIVSY